MEAKVGVFQGLPMPDYLALEAVSASDLRRVVQECVKSAWFHSPFNPNRPVQESTSAQLLGSAAHALLLEGNSDQIVVVEAENFKTKEARCQRDGALEEGKIPLLPHVFDVVLAMSLAARAFVESLKETEPAIYAMFQPGGGRAEETVVWQDGETLCKIRLDMISQDNLVVVDYKTSGTIAEPNTWLRRQAIPMGYIVSDGLYRRGVEAVFGVCEPKYVFLVQENEPPYMCSINGLDKSAEATTDTMVSRALRSWEECVKNNHWPGYPQRVAWHELPPYISAEWAEEG
jgi:hypothetical protein